MNRARTITAAATTLLVSLFLTSCRREERAFRPIPASAESVRWTSLSDLHPGGPARPDSPIVTPPGRVKNGYEDNAYSLSEGKRLYSAFNCVGCHSHGGGGMGPPLLDDKWIYGQEPEQIFSTIVEGRPNGMPSFGGRIPAYQIWWLVAYVRSMSGLTAKDAAPGREDHMKSSPPENSTASETPTHSSPPKAAEMPQ
jgi:cytochrome c oxidase cbb3-type subunit 3